jgi:hypothetical protein
VTTLEILPDDIAALRAALLAEREKRLEEAARAARIEAELAVAKAKASDDEALIAYQRLQIAKLTRQLYGQRSERSIRLLDQMELAFEEPASSASEDELAAERAVAKTTKVAAFTRKRPARQPFPAHLPREQVVEPAPTECPCCGSARLRKLGEDISETLEVIPRQWKVIQHVREKFSCRERRSARRRRRFTRSQARMTAPLIEPRETQCAPGSVEHARQQEERARAAAAPISAELLPTP